MTNIVQKYIQLIQERGYNILNVDEIKTCNSKITYICKCGETLNKLIKDCIRRGCKICNSKKIYSVPIESEYTDEKTGEIWKPVLGGWISSHGNAKNVFCKTLNLCNVKYRYHIGGKNQYASRLVAITFKIKDYEFLLDNNQKYIVSHIDKNNKNNKVENLYVRSKIDSCSVNGKKSHKSEKMNWDVNKFIDLKAKVIPELPNHLIHSNGEILNISGERFLTFSRNLESNKDIDNLYYHFNYKEKQYKVHRIVCYAFHPLPDKKCLGDYDDLQVNHTDGNKTNNSADNLEWVTPSENQIHAYTSGLKRGQAVIQISKESGEKICEFSSITLASRNSGDTEHAIRSGAKGKQNRYAKYNWEFSDEKLADIYKTKYAMK